MGLRSPLLGGILEEADLKLASWTRRALDGVSGNTTRALRRLTGTLAPGDVLLLHDGNCAPDRFGNAAVLTVLPLLLARLQRAGLPGTALPRFSQLPPPDHPGN